MKTLFFVLFWLFSLVAYAQQWPHNESGNVEFEGRGRFKVNTSADSRRMLIKKWYMQYLTRLTEKQVSEHLKSLPASEAKYLVTYPSLPTTAVLGSEEKSGGYSLAYQVRITPIKDGFSYILSEFKVSRRNEPLSPIILEVFEQTAASYPAGEDAKANEILFDMINAAIAAGQQL